MTATRVVLAEDEALIRLDLRESLISEGYEVVGEASDGAEAIELVKKTKPDVVILDIMMPVMDGITAAREITADRLAAVVILTAYPQRDLVDQANEAGVMAYLLKPIQHDRLSPTIDVAIARFREMQVAASQAESMTERLEARKVTDRAKGVLMDQHGYSEGSSYRYLQREAMAKRTTIKAVAQKVLDGGISPPPPED